MNVRNIIISIIQNNDDVGDAADMLIRLFGQPDQQGPREPRVLSPIEADQYYSVEVARLQTRYTAKHIYTLIKRGKIICKPEARPRMILGSEILRLRKARGTIVESLAREASQ